MNEVRLLATDLDGTLIGSSDEYGLYTPLRLKINELKALHNTVWVVNTGRGIKSFHSVFLPIRTAGILPDYIITEHGIAHLYGKTVKQRAKALIEVADPSFREQLYREFQDLYGRDCRG